MKVIDNIFPALKDNSIIGKSCYSINIS